MMNLRPLSRIGLLPLLAVLAAACGGGDEPPVTDPVARDWDAIQARDTLVVLAAYNSTGYFVYRGEPMGFEYDLLRGFAEEHDMALRVEVVRDRQTLLDRLRRGEGDVVAARLVPAEWEKERIAFTAPLYTTRPALVQRQPGSPAPDLPPSVDTIARRESARIPDAETTVRARLISSAAELGGERVWIPEDSRYLERLVELEDSVTGDIQVVEVEADVSTEALIRAVARGEIGLTVAGENVARLKESYFDNLVVMPALGPPRPIAWAVRENAPGLLGALNAWIASAKEDGKVDQTYKTYFEDREGFRERVESEYLTSETGQLSEYDPLFKQHARELGWDWRLLASQSYQESRFKPTAESWAGAQGLLQLMPATARAVGVRDSYDPAQNVAGATRFLRDLTTHWTPEIPDPQQRLRFILASYNVGIGHMEDARRLTVKAGGDANRWEDVSYWLLQKSKREVYSDPVVEHGYARGLEPVEYVARVLERWEHYREFVVEEGEETGAGAPPG